MYLFRHRCLCPTNISASTLLFFLLIVRVGIAIPMVMLGDCRGETSCHWLRRLAFFVAVDVAVDFVVENVDLAPSSRTLLSLGVAGDR